ncbi:Exocyst complex component 1 [Trichuris trichiura]|uniref:Exocyst complex component 1 n=1 Tax=Trichuris trichiura TaxID=36087 RepID=A0A077Z7F5_TRITR|nr:Exocyst complex component 1 [Trichuris trichiura]
MDDNVKQSIQRELFEESDERILKCIAVLTGGKRKKQTYLCVTISYFHPVTPRLHEVFLNEKIQRFALFHSWLLSEVRVVDGINPRKVNRLVQSTLSYEYAIPDLEITVDSVHRWEVCKASEKESFIRQVWKVCHRYLSSQRPEFVNISIPVDEIGIASRKFVLLCFILKIVFTVSGQQKEDASLAATSSNIDSVDDFHSISAAEEADFRALLSKYNMRIADSQQFLNKLMKELAMLDKTNMQTIVGSERQIAELLNHIDQLLTESSKLENVLDTYDQILAHVKHGVEMMEEKDMLLGVCSNNRQRLTIELRDFLSAIRLSSHDRSVLTNCDLSDPAKIMECTRAALNLQKCINAQVSPGMEKMAAYEEQMSVFSHLREKFSERFVAHLTSLFRSLVELAFFGPPNVYSLYVQAQEAIESPITDKLPKQEMIYGLLKPFSDLVSWLKASVARGYFILLKRYSDCMQDVYRSQISRFVRFLGNSVSQAFPPSRGLISASETKEVMKLVRSVPGSLTMDNTWSGSVLSANDKANFFQLINRAFLEIDSSVLQEEKFCSWFFHVTDAVAFSRAVDELLLMYNSFASNQPMKSLLAQIFACIDSIFEQFLNECEQHNSLLRKKITRCSMCRLVVYMLCALCDRAAVSEDGTSTSLSITGKLVVLLKRRFDAFMVGRNWSNDKNSQMFVIERSPKRIKYEILPTLTMFFVYRKTLFKNSNRPLVAQVFAKELEAAYENKQRRSEVDRWYPTLVRTLWQSIETAADDPHSKCPPAVVRLENYHFLHSMLSQLKISCLNDLRRETKIKYTMALESYVEDIMDNSLEKLKTFFDSISHCINQGMKPEDISYQQAYNRQELRRIVELYQLADVRKEINALYRIIESQLSEEKHLLQVVWRNVQDSFIRRYKQYDGLIDLCYPQSNARMEFSIQDLLNCFSAIAQQH